MGKGIFRKIFTNCNIFFSLLTIAYSDVGPDIIFIDTQFSFVWSVVKIYPILSKKVRKLISVYPLSALIKSN